MTVILSENFAMSFKTDDEKELRVTFIDAKTTQRIQTYFASSIEEMGDTGLSLYGSCPEWTLNKLEVAKAKMAIQMFKQFNK